MTISKRNGKYYCRFQINGERHHYLCNGASSVEEAKLQETAYRFKVDRQQQGIIPREEKDLKFKVLYKLYDNYAKLNKKSYYNDVHFINVLKIYFPETLNANSVKFSGIEDFKTRLIEDRKSSNATVNKYLGILSKMYNLGIAEKLLKENPIREVKKLKEPNYKIRYLTKEEEIRLYKAIDENFPYLRPLVVCALKTGMRRGEIFNLKWKDIDFDYGFIEVLETKSGKSRRIPISETLMEVFNELPKDSEYVFINKQTGEPYTDIHKSFTTALEIAKIENFRFHDLRHTVATRMVEKGIPLPVVQEIMGHAKISTTMRYTHVVPKQKLEAISVLDSY